MSATSSQVRGLATVQIPKAAFRLWRGRAAYTRMVTECISDRCDHVSRSPPTPCGVRPERRPADLSGFSQGAAVSAYTGLRRLLGHPAPAGRAHRGGAAAENDVTRVCAIVGDADHRVRHEEITRAFAKYPGARCDASAGVPSSPIKPTRSRSLSEHWAEILQACLAAAALNGAPNGAGG